MKRQPSEWEKVLADEPTVFHIASGVIDVKDKFLILSFLFQNPLFSALFHSV